MKIGTKLLILSLSISLVPLIVISVVSLKVSERAMKESIGRDFEHLAREKAASIKLILESRVFEAETLAASREVVEAVRLANQGYGGRTDAEVRGAIDAIDKRWIAARKPTGAALSISNNDLSGFLREYIARDPEKYGEIFITDVLGATVAMTRKLTDYYQADEAWWQYAYDGGKGSVIIDDRGYDESVGTLIVGVVVPVRDGADVIGILKINNRIRDVIEMADTRFYGERGHFMLARSNNSIIYHPVGGELNEHAELTDREAAVISASEAGWFMDFHGKAKHIEGHSPVGVDLYVRVPTEGEIKGVSGERWVPARWHIFVELDEESAFAPIARLKSTFIVLGSLTGVAVVILAFIAAGSISNPLRRLTKGVESIGRAGLGEFRVGTGSKDEVGQLSMAFDRMCDDLKDVTASRDELDREVTERKRVEEELMLFKVLADSTPDLAYICDDKGHITYINKAFELLAGFKTEEFIGKQFVPLFDEENLKKAIHFYKRTLDGETPRYELFFKKTGFLCEYKNIPLRDKEGNITGVIGIARDITERKRVEEELKKEKDRARMYLDVAGVIMVVVDASQKIVLINKKGAEVLGYSEDELLGRNWFDVACPKSVREEVRGVFVGLMMGEVEGNEFYESPVVTRSGTERLISWHNTVLRDEEGGIIAALGSGEDITELKRAEKEREKMFAELLQSQKMDAIGRMAGGIAHDFNNMMVAVKALSTLGLEKAPESDPLHNYFRNIKLASERAVNLVRQLSAFSRKQPVVLEKVNLNKEVGKMLGILPPLIGEHISISTNLEGRPRHILADRGSLSQVIMNLALNARDAMEEGGSIAIRTRNVTVDEARCTGVAGARPGEFLLLSVSDTGTGIDGSTLERIFEPFFSTKEFGKGSGLGLSVVYGIVKSHNGWIDVRSTVGKGTTFDIYLPVVEEEEEEALAAPEARPRPSRPAAGAGERILLVEDEDVVRTTTKIVLENNGYVVRDAPSTSRAIDIFEGEKGEFHLAIIDVVLPDENGVELAQRLLERKPELSVILMSGYLDERSRMAAIREKGYRFIEKPYDIPDLLEAVKETIESGSAKG